MKANDIDATIQHLTSRVLLKIQNKCLKPPKFVTQEKYF